MKKFCKRMLAVIVLYALVFTMLPTIGASAASVTKEQAVQWARSKIGKELYYDPGDMWCVDLIYYYYDYLGVPVYYGNAIDFATASAAVPAGSGWQRIPVTAGFVPQPGDIAVWKANYNWGSGWTYPEGHIGIVTCADTEGLMAVEMGHHRTPSENWFPLHAIQCVIRPNFVSSTPVSVITIQNANYPISKPNGNWFTVYGTVSSPNPLEWVQCYVTNTAGDWIFAAGWGFTPAEKAQTITTYDINALDSQMIFASLPAGTYIYHVDAYDKKGYFADIDQTFTVGNVAASSGVITQAGRHMHQNDFPGYSWGEWEVTKEATYDSEGSRQRTCSACGYVAVEAIPEKEHSAEWYQQKHEEEMADKLPYVGMSGDDIDKTSLGVHDKIGHNEQITPKNDGSGYSNVHECTLYYWYEGTHCKFLARVDDVTNEVIHVEEYPAGAIFGN